MQFFMWKDKCCTSLSFIVTCQFGVCIYCQRTNSVKNGLNCAVMQGSAEYYASNELTILIGAVYITMQTLFCIECKHKMIGIYRIILLILPAHIWMKHILECYFPNIAITVINPFILVPYNTRICKNSIFMYAIT